MLVVDFSSYTLSHIEREGGVGKIKREIQRELDITGTR